MTEKTPPTYHIINGIRLTELLQHSQSQFAGSHNDVTFLFGNDKLLFYLGLTNDLYTLHFQNGINRSKLHTIEMV